MGTESFPGRAVLRARLLQGGAVAASAAAVLAFAPAAGAHRSSHHWQFGQRSALVPGSLVISGSTYPRDGVDITDGTTQLPPNCTTGNCGTAVAGGDYPYVFNNDLADGSFGLTSDAYLYDVTPWGAPLARIAIPSEDLVTSFSSKSELALNFSTDGRDLTFSGYATAPGTIDVSNSNTPGVIDPTNPVPGAYYRVVGDLNSHGRWSFTEDNAYSGNNERAAILDNADNDIYTAGNAGNGNNPQPLGVVLGAGAQIFQRSFLPESEQSPGQPTPVASFDVSQLNYPEDKIGKDDNFRGLTIYNNVLYYTKGSGSNGVNTVYYLNTSGTTCTGGVGLPQPGVTLPTAPLNPSTVWGTTWPAFPTTPLPSNMCVLKGFNTLSAKGKNAPNSFPFGVWFANADTLYVADEGNGTNTYDPTTGTYTVAASQTTAGLQKWVFNGTTWQLAYTLQNGLNLGRPYTVQGYPTGDNVVTTGGTTTDYGPWAPATDGLRNIAGRVNPNGTVTIYAVTSTVSGSGDQGADPNKVVAITDELGATAPGSEKFSTVKSARAGQVLRGVAIVPRSF